MEQGLTSCPTYIEANAMTLAFEGKKKKASLRSQPAKKQATRLKSVSLTEDFWAIFKERSRRRYAYPIELYYFTIVRA